MSIGDKIIKLDSVGSTNSLILSDQYTSMPDGTVITTKIQRAGRGRAGKIWFSPRGGLYFSILLHARRHLNEYNKLALMFAYAIREQLLKHAPKKEIKIKWPNDIFVDERKIAGILIQAKTLGDKTRVAIGIGINLNIGEGDFPEDLNRSAISLSEITGDKIDIDAFLRDLLPKLDIAYRQFLDGGFEKLLEKINPILYCKGRESEFILKGKKKTFRVLAIHPDARLRVYSPETGITTLDLIDLK